YSRLFERSLGDAELEGAHRFAFAATARFRPAFAAFGPFGEAGAVEKHVRWPVWQTLPSPSRSALTSTVSSSQSTRISFTARRLPEVSPLVQSVLRVRLKKVTYPVACVSRHASSFMKPTINTSPLAWSWTTAGMRPSSLLKSICLLLPGHRRWRQTKKARWFPSGLLRETNSLWVVFD